MTKWVKIYGKEGRNPKREEYWNEEERLYNTFIIAFEKKGTICHGFGLYDGKDWNSTRLEKINSVIAWAPFEKFREETEEKEEKTEEKKTLYIIGIPENEKNFLTAIKALEENDLKCICSYKLEFDKKIENLLQSNYVLILPNYEKDGFSLAEYNVALANNIPIIDNSHLNIPDFTCKKPLVYLSGNCSDRIELDTIKNILKSYGFNYCISKNSKYPIPWIIYKEEVEEILSKCDYILYLPESSLSSEIEKNLAIRMGISTIKL